MPLRCPEYLCLVGKRTVTVPSVKEHREAFRLERWIHLAAETYRKILAESDGE